jgi:predicted secreted hydrolase
VETEAVNRKLESAVKDGTVHRVLGKDFIGEAVEKGVLTQEEGALLREREELVAKVIAVDHFDPDEITGKSAIGHNSRPRAAGTIVDVGGTPHEVAGRAWMDREWGTSALSPGVEGWDWFALQLDDGSDLMLYRLRDRNGDTNAFSGGSLVSADGQVETLAAADIRLTATRHWTSTASGIRYPVGWEIGLPRLGIDLTVTPRLDDQELNLSVRYWEGAVVATGSSQGEAIKGQGYLELAGY